MRFFILLIGVFLFGQVGDIVEFKGKVDILRSEKIIHVKSKMPVDVNDTIVTYDNSKAKVVFKDNTIITIGENSTFNIKEYLYENNNSKAEFNFLKGTFISVTGKIGKIAPKRFKLKTKNSSIGIRGTIVVGKVGIVDTIACTQGAIVVVNKMGAKVFLKAGEAVKVGTDFISKPFVIGAKFLYSISKTLFKGVGVIGGILFSSKGDSNLENKKESNLSKSNISEVNFSKQEFNGSRELNVSEINLSKEVNLSKEINLSETNLSKDINLSGYKELNLSENNLTLNKELNITKEINLTSSKNKESNLSLKVEVNKSKTSDNLNTIYKKIYKKENQKEFYFEFEDEIFKDRYLY